MLHSPSTAIALKASSCSGQRIAAAFVRLGRLLASLERKSFGETRDAAKQETGSLKWQV